MAKPAEPCAIVVMGVSGSGKTLIGRKLSRALNASFIEGDKFHPLENIERMRKGVPLDDEHRALWLEKVGSKIRAENEHGKGAVAACSALKLIYRDQLRRIVPQLRFLFLDIDQATANERVSARRNHFMPASLVASQFQTLERLEQGELGLRVDARSSPDKIVVEAFEYFSDSVAGR